MAPVTKTTVAIGPTSVAGYSISLGAFIAAIVSTVTGDSNAETWSTIAFAALSALSLIPTQLGRYRQAVEQLRKGPGWTTPNDEDDEDDEQLEADELHSEATAFNEPDLEAIPPDEGDPNPPRDPTMPQS